MVPAVSAVLGSSYAACGRVQEAVSLLENAVGTADATQRRILQPQKLALLGTAYLAQGRVSDADNCAETAIRLSAELNEQGGRAYAELLKGDILCRRTSADPQQAIEHYWNSIRIAETLSMSPLAARAHQALGALYLNLGQRSEAAEQFSAQLRLWRAMGVASEIANTETALTQCCRDDEISMDP